MTADVRSPAPPGLAGADVPEVSRCTGRLSDEPPAPVPPVDSGPDGVTGEVGTIGAGAPAVPSDRVLPSEVDGTSASGERAEPGRPEVWAPVGPCAAARCTVTAGPAAAPPVSGVEPAGGALSGAPSSGRRRGVEAPDGALPRRVPTGGGNGTVGESEEDPAPEARSDWEPSPGPGPGELPLASPPPLGAPSRAVRRCTGTAPPGAGAAGRAEEVGSPSPRGTSGTEGVGPGATVPPCASVRSGATGDGTEPRAPTGGGVGV